AGASRPPVAHVSGPTPPAGATHRAPLARVAVTPVVHGFPHAGSDSLSPATTATTHESSRKPTRRKPSPTGARTRCAHAHVWPCRRRQAARRTASGLCQPV